MTFEQFIEELKECAKDFNWSIVDSSRIRGTVVKKANWFKRLIGIENDTVETYCPMTAVYKKRTGEYLTIGDSFLTTKRMDINGFGYIIVLSADQITGVQPYLGVRQQLLNAIGLEEKNDA